MADDFRPVTAGDFGTSSLIQHWKRLRDQQFGAAVASASGSSQVLGVSAPGEGVRVIDIPNAELIASGQPPAAVVSFPEILVGAALVDKGDKVPDGDIIIAITPLFRRFLRELERDSNALYQLDPRQFEELIAGAYEEEGCEEVILTPSSGDKGRDVIATSKLFGTIRILDQVKLFKPNHIVEPDDVRALYGVLTNDLRASKAVITTTSRFGQRVYEEFSRQIPSRVELRNGEQVRARLQKLNRA